MNLNNSVNKKTLGFHADIKRVLRLVIDSLYSKKDIFLRELISNASDALDKLRFLAISNPLLYEDDSELKIKVDFDLNKTIIISDNGIGLNWNEAIENLGMIAKSGTKEFVDKLINNKEKNIDLIGQFGVGFYSAFIVSKKVIVKSRKAGLSSDDGIVWESDGCGEFTISKENIKHRGTKVILYLKENSDEYLNDWSIRSVINKYSNHICWPIMMRKYEKNNNDRSLDEKNNIRYEVINQSNALWTLSKHEISDEKYQRFYKNSFNDSKDPLLWIHSKIEGKKDYIVLIYIPKYVPFDIYQKEHKYGLKLYVKRVFIMDHANQFIPRYLRFVKGIVDTFGLPLNISREMLQDNKQVNSIKSYCTKRILSALEKISIESPDIYEEFWNSFGLFLKEGPIEDYENRENILKLLRFFSTHSFLDKKKISIFDYVSRMQKDQNKIFYLIASNYLSAINNPLLEVFRKKNIEVLLLIDKIDEWLISYIGEYKGKKFQSISKGKIDSIVDRNIYSISEDKDNKLLTIIINKVKNVLEKHVKDVRSTNRLENFPVCIVADDNDMGLEMKRLLKEVGQKVPESNPIFEINPNHLLVKNLYHIDDNELFSDYVFMLYYQALLVESGKLENPLDFINLVNKFLSNYIDKNVKLIKLS
ncbi:molecular chaperone HtpG [Candidatus Legionella polyplacis]|uniref:molecular chaperone HtpG n=1 Tax=Candidatus Legionella polyplacis TaxID=2005262 RepID=UPI000C1E7CD8|nr:molecular chaperone HtpG [Candidatus Legionella polyplacis]ATW01701.1 molecular chaperone HtpG [Candidatus Legionella polyplacis]